MKVKKDNKIKKISISIIVFFAVFFMAIEGYIIAAPYTNKAKKSDAIIILGCRVGKPFLENRTKKAYELYSEGLSKKIIVTGGVGQGLDISEAQWEKDYLLELGVDEEDILLENKSKDTFQNLEFSKKIMDENNMKSAIVVSNSFHLRRANTIANKKRIDVSLAGVFDKRFVKDEVYGYLREVPALLKDFILR